MIEKVAALASSLPQSIQDWQSSWQSSWQSAVPSVPAVPAVPAAQQLPPPPSWQTTSAAIAAAVHSRLFHENGNLNLAAVAVLAVLLLTAYSYIRELAARLYFGYKHGCRPVRSGPLYESLLLGIPLIRDSSTAFKKHRLIDFARERYERFGSTFLSRRFTTRIITTIDKENIKAVLADRFDDFTLGGRDNTLKPLLGAGIFTSDGAAWRRSRDMVRPNFEHKQVANLASFEKHFQEMVRLIPADGATVDLQDLFFKLTIDSATEFLFGRSTNSLSASQPGATGAGAAGERSAEAKFATAFNYAQKDVAVRFRFGFLYALAPDRAAAEAIETCHQFVGQFVDDALKYRAELEGGAGGKGGPGQSSENAKEETYVFLQELAKQTKDRVQLRSELLNILLAGRDTTASLLSNMWFTIAKRPDIFMKLKEEVAILDGEKPTFDDLRKLKYLRYTIQESLRYHPVVPFNSREAVRDTYIPRGGGRDGSAPVFVPRGTLVSYSVSVMHRRKDYYGPDADEFRPERWEANRPGWHYLPFNGGPRICVGQQYALVEASYVSARLLQAYAAIESRDSGPWEEDVHLTLSSRNGTKVGLFRDGPAQDQEKPAGTAL